MPARVVVSTLLITCAAAAIVAVILSGRGSPSSALTGTSSSDAGKHSGARSRGQTTPKSTTRRLALGVDVSADPSKSVLERYRRIAGKSPAFVEWFSSFNEPLFYPSQMTAVHQAGSIPMITWDPIARRGVSLQAIARGHVDAYLRRNAKATAAVRAPVFIRFAHEMNLSKWPWSPTSQHVAATTFIEAWRHVVDVFRQQGATNVRWVWSPNALCGGSCPFDAYYPGDRWVDYLGLDGYNYGPTTGQLWLNLDSIFLASYHDITRLSSKPLLITATGTAEYGGAKASWITNGLLHEVPAELPRVIGVVYTDRAIEEPWQVTTSSASLAAWRRVVASRLYSGRIN